MPADPILTFHSDAHASHAPTVEFLHGRLVPYFEVPHRVDVLRESLCAAGLIRLQTPATAISRSALTATHDPGMIDYLEGLSVSVADLVREDFQVYGLDHMLLGDEYFYESIFPTRLMRARADSDDMPDQRGFYIFDSTSPVGKGTWKAVLHSATLAYAGAQALLNGDSRAYALCRPPGHHAGRDFAGGYCYLNNAAIAANTLRSRGRVALLDIDYHHGNGTQAIFWHDPDVLFVSLHSDPAVDYPHYAGYADEIGAPGAEHATLNIPLPHGTGEREYLAALTGALDRIREFGAESLVVSLGFDTFRDDPMAAFELEVSSFAELGRAIAGLGLPTLYVQEGGYHVDALGDLAVSFFGGVVG